MIRILYIVAILSLIGGCTIHQSIGDNYGTFVGKPKGQDFQPAGARWDHERTALMYVYRPGSQWANDEIEAPSFNVNDKRLFNIKGGSYTWYELKPGEYNVVMRRGLFGLEGVNSFEIKRIASLALEAVAGETYYLRYSEIDTPKDSDKPLQDRLGDGPLQLVSEEFALSELSATKMLHHGRDLLEPRFVASVQAESSAADPSSDSRDSGGAAEELEPATDKATTKEEWWPF